MTYIIRTLFFYGTRCPDIIQEFVWCLPQPGLVPGRALVRQQSRIKICDIIQNHVFLFLIHGLLLLPDNLKQTPTTLPDKQPDENRVARKKNSPRYAQGHPATWETIKTVGAMRVSWNRTRRKKLRLQKYLSEYEKDAMPMYWC